MSTKISLGYYVDDTTGVKTHLTEECLAPDDFPVTLELYGVPEASLELTDNGNHLSVVVPRALAVQMTLLPKESENNATRAPQRNKLGAENWSHRSISGLGRAIA